jgi:hypothetical protein
VDQEKNKPMSSKIVQVQHVYKFLGHEAGKTPSLL